MDATSYTAPPTVDQARVRAMAVGAVALIVGVGIAFAFGGLDRSLYSWLIGFSFWAGVSLGCLALALLHNLSGGAWGQVIRRPLGAAAATLPLMALFLLPILFGVGEIYHWADAEAVAHDHILQHKSPYLNVPFFVGRQVGYFALWMGLATLLVRWSTAFDRTGDQTFVDKMRSISGPGLALYALTVTFASVDWIMSLDAHWFSTIFGILTIGGQALSALALMVAVLVLLSRTEPMSKIVTPQNFHDLGKLMLAFVMLWAYFSLSQFLITWAGNLPEELPWYLRRLNTEWRWVGLALALFHFALPFALLLSRDLKRRANRLVWVAGLVIVMRMIDTVWMVAPEFHGEGGLADKAAVLADFLVIVGIGGIWVWFFLGRLKSRPLMPLHDPLVAKAAVEAEA
jgi:hypothetical protein